MLKGNSRVSPPQRSKPRALSRRKKWPTKAAEPKLDGRGGAPSATLFGWNQIFSARLNSSAVAWRVAMREPGWTPSIVPKQEDGQTVYIVLDDFGRNGRAYRETDVERSDLEAVIMDMLEGQYKNPVRVVGFNTVEGWSRDVSADVAQEVRHRCDLQMRDVPFYLQDFCDRFDRYRDVQLPLRLV
jgi:hypothetical protein